MPVAKGSDPMRMRPNDVSVATETMTAFEHWVEAHRTDNVHIPKWIPARLQDDVDCLTSEVGEVNGVLKAGARSKFATNEEFREYMLLELGDVLHYISRCLADIDSDFEECVNANVEKLTNRMNYGKGQKGLRS